MNFSAPLTRAHLATILARCTAAPGRWRKAETSMPPSANFRTFQTGPGNMPVTAPTIGLMVGYGDGLFGAEDPVTPAAACTVILRYLALPDLVWITTAPAALACDLGQK